MERIVVGLPVSLNGTEGPAAAAARAFAAAVAEATGLPVELADERFTSVSAERVLVRGRPVRAAAPRRARPGGGGGIAAGVLGWWAMSDQRSRVPAERTTRTAG